MQPHTSVHIPNSINNRFTTHSLRYHYINTLHICIYIAHTLLSHVIYGAQWIHATFTNRSRNMIRTHSISTHHIHTYRLFTQVHCTYAFHHNHIHHCCCTFSHASYAIFMPLLSFTNTYYFPHTYVIFHMR